ncbi:DMT family transporter [Oceanospirillaceae bacterium]|nr:DMT family transporter [Oceanospirillaceae bacterium]MDB9752551.1 DMT family transporter [Oceanospirillaceae bacterium]
MILKPAGIQAYTLLTIQGAVWGSSFQAIKYALDGFGPMTISAGRILIAALVLLVYALMKGDRLPRSPCVWMNFLLIGFFSCALPFFLIPWGEQTLDSGRASIFMATSPLIAIVLAYFTSNNEQITGYKALGFIIGFIGVLFVIGLDTFDSGVGELLPQLAIIVAAASYVVSGAMVKQMKGVSSAMLAAGVLLGGCLVTVPASLLLENPLGDVANVSDSAIIALVYLGLVPTGAAFFVRFYLIRVYGYTFIAQVGYLVPLFSVLFGAVLLDETLTISMFVGLLLIFGGIMISRRGAKHS